MIKARTSLRNRWMGPVLAGCALSLALLPSAGLALGAFESETLSFGRSFGGADGPAVFTPASVDPQLARFVAERRGVSGGLKRFTPAGVDARASRTMTVAVRVDAEEARAIQVRSAIRAAAESAAEGASGVNLGSTRYNLGLARGYQGFAQTAAKAAIEPTPLADAAIPDLAAFRPTPGVAREESRFAARIAADKIGVTDEAGPRIAARVADPVAEQTVDLAGSYRLTRNLDVTAGVRYSQERARLAPLPPQVEDSQAVYIGTQFRF